jgi:hypothetical protein
MPAITFDTHEFIKTLEEGGVSPGLAGALTRWMLVLIVAATAVPLLAKLFA